MRRLGVLGGTFDPVHFGHLDAADAARGTLGLDGVLFIPLHDPPHRPADPQASAFHRFAMLSLAVAERPGDRVSDMELLRAGTSYTWDTLDMLRDQGWNAGELFVILGGDAFADIATWHRYPSVLDCANFVVVARPGTTADSAIARNPELRSRSNITLIEARTRDVSSTTIRRRIAQGLPIDDLVPAPVARHITTHHLYEPRAVS
ncbi:MAG: nicotinate (nicotinamide) nucleotide adenylyltransferase [Acidimicrobiia bacterium]|nr:nicotinate (nicotinamide) nucleotide adenylyltransferase [Acidimicrobiia bacterium]